MLSALTNDFRASLSALVGRHLPQLRRYARALTGSQADGDRAVEDMLIALKGRPAMIPPRDRSKAGVFRAFETAWRRSAENVERGSSLARRYLLLTALEGFDPADAARILGAAPSSAGNLEAEARIELARFVKARIAIIEDEPAIALHLEQLALDHGHVVTGIADTHGRAVELISRTRPDLVLADIQLADGSSGIDAINEISASYPAPVIFITAYPERLLTGARAEATYLIAKPFADDEVRATIAMALYNHSGERTLSAV